MLTNLFPAQPGTPQDRHPGWYVDSNIHLVDFARSWYYTYNNVELEPGIAAGGIADNLGLLRAELGPVLEASPHSYAVAAWTVPIEYLHGSWANLGPYFGTRKQRCMFVKDELRPDWSACLYFRTLRRKEE
jgi:hypothetical protein